jgi:hypothetical protein
MSQFCNVLLADHRPIFRFNEPNQTDSSVASPVASSFILADTLGLFSGLKSQPESRIP